MPNPLAKKTIAKIAAALEEDQTTAISEIIQIIQELAGKAFSISISELSQLIGRDPTITEKVISAANTLGFNPSGTPISTISEAIHTVGFEKIRNLAISLMLAENAGKHLNTYEQREIAALSVCSGMMAQSLLGETNSNIESELLFVCSSLRNYGKLLMSTFLVDEYREAKSLALDMPSDAAFREVFGLTPLGLGRLLLESTNLPRSIMSSLREVPPSILDHVTQSQEDEILVMAEFAVCISSIAFDDNISAEDFNQALTETIGRFSKSFPISLEAVNQALIDVETSMSQLNRAIGIRDENSRPIMKLRARVNGDPLPEPPPESRITSKKRKPVAEMNEAEREEHIDDTYQQETKKLAELLVPGERIVLKDVYQSVANTIQTALELENCLIFVREEFDTHCLSARYGLGPLFDRVKNRPLIAPDKKDIFSICLARREDILIQDTNAGKIKSVIPEWIHQCSDTTSFIILPISLEKHLFSIIVGTVSHGRAVELKDGDLRYLRIIRNHLATLKQMGDENVLTIL